MNFLAKKNFLYLFVKLPLIVFFLLIWNKNTVNCFSDISAENPDLNIYQHLVDVKIMSTRADGSFGLNDTMTRAEGLAIALRAGGISIPDYDGEFLFEDVEPNQWYTPYISRAKKLGFISQKNTHFYPNNVLTKSEFLAFLFRASVINLNKENLQTKNISLDITGDEWFAPYFAYAKKYQIAVLPVDKFYQPQEILTRKSVALITYKQLKLFHGDEITKIFVELEGQINQFINLLNVGESSNAEFHLQRILDLSRTLTLKKNNVNAFAARSISQSIDNLVTAMRSMKTNDNLKGLEYLYLSLFHARKAEKKESSLSPTANQLVQLIEKIMLNISNPLQ